MQGKGLTQCYIVKRAFCWNNSALMRVWSEEKCNDTDLAFSGEMCACHLSRLFSAACSKCDVHTFSAELATHYILLSLCVGEDILKTSTFWFVIHTRPHTLFFPVSTLSDNVTSIVRSLNKQKPYAWTVRTVYLFTNLHLFSVFSFLFQWCGICPCLNLFYFFQEQKKNGV